MLLCPSWIEETDVHQDFPKQCFCCPNMETLQHHFALRRSFFAVELPSGCTRFVCTVCNGDLLMSSCFIVLTRSKSKCSFVSQCQFTNIKRFFDQKWRFRLVEILSVELQLGSFGFDLVSGYFHVWPQITVDQRNMLQSQIKVLSLFCVFIQERSVHLFDMVIVMVGHSLKRSHRQQKIAFAKFKVKIRFQILSLYKSFGLNIPTHPAPTPVHTRTPCQKLRPNDLNCQREALFSLHISK